MCTHARLTSSGLLRTRLKSRHSKSRLASGIHTPRKGLTRYAFLFFSPDDFDRRSDWGQWQRCEHKRRNPTRTDCASTLPSQTGLFLGTANALRHGGPLGLCLGFTIMGSIVYAVMVSGLSLIGQRPVLTLGLASDHPRRNDFYAARGWRTHHACQPLRRPWIQLCARLVVLVYLGACIAS